MSAEPSRQPKCSRCRHHGLIVPQKGHSKVCPFLHCDCWKCDLVTERTRIQRNLKTAHNKEKCPREDAGHRAPAAASAPDVCAHPSGTSGQQSAPSGGLPWSERDAMNAERPLDLRTRPADGGLTVTGQESRNGQLYTSREEGPCAPFSGPCAVEFEQTPPLPVIHFPFGMSRHYSSSYNLCPNIVLNMPWMPPLPVGSFNDGLYGPLMFPHYSSPSDPGPPAMLGMQIVVDPSVMSAPEGQTHQDMERKK
ncbi:doublesex- and mab-3-related transcription factor 1-like [Cheilinus undulatus]|uniref:doublesex- and mab-3-related transcription factor 1-like n=1 Tax=Cheilinus undulatus TaxID=241271 RepID=UPI001BD644FA|nr:doublesex- and mab-3-related transcription factor 1-like [Cheilinus undulatus]